MFFRVRLACLALVATLGIRAADAPAFVIQNDQVAPPSGPGALSPELSRSPQGIIYLSWLESLPAGGHALRLSTFDAAHRAWSPARTIAEGSNWVINAADTPQLAAGADGQLTAVWLVANPSTGHSHGHHGTSHALVSTSNNDGATWSAPTPLSSESALNERIVLRPLADGRVLAAWLDGRVRAQGKAVTQLYARIVGSADADQLVDPRVCECCQTALVAFPNGDALVAYRGRSEDEVRDILTARYRDGAWESPRVLNNDGWKIAGCPINGPVLTARGPKVAAAWFTAAEGAPRVLASTSMDAGGKFLMPLRLDDTKPLGRVDAVLLADDSALVSWVEGGAGDEAGIFMRRISPRATLNVPVRLAQTKAPRSAGFPRMALVKDYDATPAQLILAAVEPGGSAGLMTRLITLPAAATITEIDTCDCAPKTEEQRGFPVRGEIISIDAETGTLLVKHEEIPGVMRAMTMQFRVAPNVLKAVRPERKILARIERRGAQWWMFDVRMLVGPRPASAPAAP